MENLLPSSTALFAYDTLNAETGRKSGIKFALAGLKAAGVAGIISSRRNAFRALDSSAGVAIRHVWRCSRAASGRAAALTVAARARMENNMLEIGIVKAVLKVVRWKRYLACILGGLYYMCSPRDTCPDADAINGVLRFKILKAVM